MRNVAESPRDGSVGTLSGLIDFTRQVVLRFLEFLHRLTHAPRELRESLCAEEHQDDEQDDEQVWSGKVRKASAVIV